MGDAFLTEFDRDQREKPAAVDKPEEMLEHYEQQRQHAAWTQYLRDLLKRGADIRPMLAKGPPDKDAAAEQQAAEQQAAEQEAKLARAPKAVGAPGDGEAPGDEAPQ